MKSGIFRPDIRQRLWIALGLLTASTLFVGGIAWYALEGANSRLEQLHSQTLFEVARSLKLSKQSADLASSAPVLLNLSSPYLIQREGQVLLEAIDPVLADWSEQEGEVAGKFLQGTQIVVAVQETRKAIIDLVHAAEQLNVQSDMSLALIARLSQLEEIFYQQSQNATVPEGKRPGWVSLRTMATELRAAGHAENLLGVGERRRRFQVELRKFVGQETSETQQEYSETLYTIALGQKGLFTIRRRELAHKLSSQNALFRIRYYAGEIGDLAARVASDAEEILSKERSETAISINIAKAVILLSGTISVALALLSAVFVSGYVTRNIHLISDAMMRLAGGDRGARLSRRVKSDDEIGKLIHAFRVFRINSLRLDRTNRQLNQKNALFEKVFENITDGIIVTNETGQITAANPNIQQVLKLDPECRIERMKIEELLEYSPFINAIKAAGLNARFRGATEIQSEEGQYVDVRVSRLPDGGRVWLFSDTTEQITIAQRLRQIEHIESLGKVAGEVAHDFGNILSTIATNLYLMEHSLEKGKSDSDMRERISNAVEIGNALIERLLTFARKQRLEPEITEVNDLVTGVHDLISIGLKSGVVLRTVLYQNDIFVRVDPGQLESAILNLCLNSNQAISKIGEIVIAVKKLSGERVAIDIKDNGSGMEASVLSRALEPFFTAREDGEGTGLGLSMVYGFIKQTGGDLQIHSAPGKGTSVCLILPEAEEKAFLNPGAIKEQTILLVEDEPTTLSQVSKDLSSLGLNVYEADNFNMAQNLLHSLSDINTLVTDIHLDGGHSGWVLAENILLRSDNTRVIVTSGRVQTNHPLMRLYGDRLRCLEKPVDRADLEQALL